MLKKKPAKVFTNPFKGQEPSIQRLQVLAVELALAGGEVLKQDYNFTDEMVAEWIDKLLDRAKKNRKTTLGNVVRQIEQ